MFGADSFFDGKLLAEIRIGPMQLAQAGGGDGEKDGDKGSRKGKGLNGNVQVNGNNQGTNVGGGLGYDFGGASLGLGTGGGGMSFGGGGGGMGGGGGPGGGGPGGGGRPPSGGGGRSGGPGSMGVSGPLAIIHLRLTNRGTERLDFRIVDFLSPIGNFVVQPEHVVLEPGQSVETEPMYSQLVGSLTTTDVTLVLRTTTRNEKKVLTLKSAIPAPAAPPAETAAPTSAAGTAH